MSEESLFPDPISSDPWLPHFHAIGVTTTIWNSLEDYVGMFVLEMGDIHYDRPLVPLLDKGGNASKADLLVNLAARRGWEPEGQAELEYFVGALSICRENRNIVMRSRVAPNLAGVLQMQKMSRLGTPPTFTDDLEAIRRVAQDMSDYLEFLLAIMDTAWRRSAAGRAIAGKTGGPPPAWPQRPRLPRKLSVLST